MLFLTIEQHQEVVRRLEALGRKSAGKFPYHQAGIEYTSLMICFMMHNLSVAETLLRLADSFGREWFPVTIGYTITRTMFEIDVNGHYITLSPKDRACQYIDFGHVLSKQRMDACSKHRKSNDPQWREAMTKMWQMDWQSRERDVNEKFNSIAPRFIRADRKGKQKIFQNWSGISLRQMAAEVDHVEAYDIFYAELSSFAHADVQLADRFLHNRADGPAWSQRADEVDVGIVFARAASFLTCYLKLIGRQFNTWSETEVDSCWKVKGDLPYGRPAHDGQAPNVIF